MMTSDGLQTSYCLYFLDVWSKAQERIDKPYLTNIYLLTDHERCSQREDKLCFIRGNISYFKSS
jgi:hypothetical protein